MEVFRSLAEIPVGFGSSVVTVGNFDGVHCGHRWVITEVLERAKTVNAKSVAITFEPHPVRVLKPEHPVFLLTPTEEKLRLLEETGLDAVLVLPFTPELSRTTAREFATSVLRDSLRAVEVHEGENFRFGYQAHGDTASLTELGKELGFGVKVYAPRIMRGGAISSSGIRYLVAEGKVEAARALLGRPFAVHSTPASGRGYGTKYAVPTINLAAYAELLPGFGVYVTLLQIGDEVFEGVTNVGNRPTFGVDSFAVETHLLNFHPVDLTESTPLKMTFLKRLRGEKKWESPEALKAQIMKDVGRAQRWFRLSHRLAAGIFRANRLTTV